MSLFGADFLRNANRLLYVDGKSNPDVQVRFVTFFIAPSRFANLTFSEKLFKHIILQVTAKLSKRIRGDNKGKDKVFFLVDDICE
jgi:hypothetical protein